MRTVSTAFFACLLAMSSALAQQAPLIRVMEHVRADEWDAAYVTARPAGQVARDIVAWRQLRAGMGEFDAYLDFLTRNGDWPGLDRVRLRGEATLSPHTPADRILSFFGDMAPQSGNGARHLARALRQTGRPAAADEVVLRAWRGIVMTDSEERDLLLSGHGALLRPHNAERLDMLLWRGRTGEAGDFLNHLGDDWQALARARIALRRDRSGVDALIGKIPGALADDPGLAHERFLWRVRRGFMDPAVDLLAERSRSAGALGQPSRWAGQRLRLARQLMGDGRARTAYELASAHHLSKGAAYADLEWLAGYIALRKLNDPAAALRHFRRFRAAVFMPISLGRAGYWEGLAQEAAGNTEGALAAFSFAAEYQTGFYGLLAAERAGLDLDPSLAATEDFPDWRQAGFVQSPVVRAALLFHEAGELNLAEWFLVHLSERLDRTGLGQLGDMALSLDEPHLAVRIAKQAVRQGHVLTGIYFPEHPLAKENLLAKPELALAIARRESEFDAGVTSPAGARGLMQLMPATARSVAREIGEDYRPEALLTDWRYNARLGAAYLDRLTGEFGRSHVLIAAAYNAGPGRVRQWIDRHGDPRQPGVDPVDWIEHIPFHETRNYVMRVMESLPVYRARLTRQTGPVRLSRELRGAPPRGL